MGFKSGVVAGAASIAVAVLVKIILVDAPFAPEIIAQAIISITPAALSYRIIEVLGSAAKYLAVLLGTALLLCFYGFLGIILTYVQEFKRSGVVGVLVSTTLAYSTTLTLVLLAASLSGDLLRIEFSSLIIYHIPLSVIFGIIVGAPYLMAVAPHSLRSNVKRRRLIKRLILGTPFVAAVISALVYLTLSKSAEERLSEPPVNPLKPLADYEVTPTPLFFSVSKDFVSPTVDVERWVLKVNGLVGDPLQLRFDDIKAMPQVEEYATLECVSNPVGGDLISTALWRGVTVRSILEKAEVKNDAKYVVFRCSDGYSVGIPLHVALDGVTILAYEMNNQPLAADHGYPLRLITSKYYGMMNPKWITEIEVVDRVYMGFWQKLGWANEAEYQTHSTILVPGYSPLRKRFGLDPKPQETRLGDIVRIFGIAFAGDRGISKVEVSLDDGSTWLPADFKKPLSKYTWVIWWFDWEVNTLGSYLIKVRATDGNGNLQSDDLSEPFPKGASGYHTIVVHVETT
jgi:DMSO/TMAO reductase YedYZ molybdopterin-dependent catalytic subunit